MSENRIIVTLFQKGQISAQEDNEFFSSFLEKIGDQKIENWVGIDIYMRTCQEGKQLGWSLIGHLVLVISCMYSAHCFL